MPEDDRDDRRGRPRWHRSGEGRRIAVGSQWRTRSTPAVRVVRPRVGDVRDRQRDDVDRGVGEDAVARLDGSDHDRALRDLRPQLVHEPRRERQRIGRHARAPVPEAVDHHGQHEQGRCGSAEDVPRRGSAGRNSNTEPERERAADERDPRGRRRAAVPQPVVEVAGPEPLQHDPGDERHRQDEPRARGDEQAAGERERERHEAGRAARLRERDGVREVDEERRHQHQHEHDDRPAEHERGPAPAPGERGQRHERERGDRDGAGPPEHLGREPVVVRVDTTSC